MNKANHDGGLYNQLINKGNLHKQMKLKLSLPPTIQWR